MKKSGDFTNYWIQRRQGCYLAPGGITHLDTLGYEFLSGALLPGAQFLRYAVLDQESFVALEAYALS